MKIFVSYSRRDAGDFAEQIQRHFASFGQYEVFTDVNSIKVGEIWSNTIEDNISNCDIFVVIATNGALQSPHVENEVLQAQREKKRIIPCFHRNVRDNEIKWGLNKIQGVEFEDKYELARNLYSKIADNRGEGDRNARLRSMKHQRLNVKIIVPILVAGAAAIGLIIVLNNYPIPPQQEKIPPQQEEYSFQQAWGINDANGTLDVAVDSSDNVYVADGNGQRIQKFASNGTFLTQWGSPALAMLGGEDKERFSRPMGIAVDSSDNVFVIDSARRQPIIKQFASNG